MKLKLHGGAEIDVLTREDMPELAHAVSKGVQAAIITERQRRMPVALKVGDVISMPAAGIGWADLGGPPDGFVWDIRKVVCSGGDPAAAVSSASVMLFASTIPTGASAAATIASDFEDAAAAVPAIFTYGRHQFSIYPTDHLIVGFAGAASGTQLFVMARVVQVAHNTREDRSI